MLVAFPLTNAVPSAPGSPNLRSAPTMEARRARLQARQPASESSHPALYRAYSAALSVAPPPLPGTTVARRSREPRCGKEPDSRGDAQKGAGYSLGRRRGADRKPRRDAARRAQAPHAADPGAKPEQLAGRGIGHNSRSALPAHRLGGPALGFAPDVLPRARRLRHELARTGPGPAPQLDRGRSAAAVPVRASSPRRPGRASGGSAGARGSDGERIARPGRFERVRRALRCCVCAVAGRVPPAIPHPPQTCWHHITALCSAPLGRTAFFVACYFYFRFNFIFIFC